LSEEFDGVISERVKIMWTRSELKARGKAAFKANYFNCLLISLIIAVVAAGGAASGATTTTTTTNNGGEINSFVDGFSSLPAPARFGVGAAVIGFTASLGLIAILIHFFVFNPVEVGCRRFFFLNSYSPAKLDELKYGFSEGRFSSIVKTMFFRDLFVFLWSLLLIIPGIIKGYSYKMVPYILAEDPYLDYKDALNLSRTMMDGQKWRAFVLDLSFFGWYFLSALTLGILEIFYVNPYTCATDAELYRVLRQEYIQTPETQSQSEAAVQM